MINSKRASFVVAALLPAFGTGCGGSSGGSPCVVSSVAIAASPTSLYGAATSSLTATVNSTGHCTGAVTWSASPAGGTLAPNGTTATFGSSTPATYTVVARSNDDSARSGSAMVTVAACGTPSGVVVTHAANIGASETWAGNGVTHSVPSSIQVDAPATVTIQPCALVALGQNASITVRGDTVGNRIATLYAAGTDDDNGFVAFVAADAGKPWGILRGYNEKALIDLRHTVVQGGGNFGGQYRNPAIASSGPGYSVLPAEVLRVQNVLLKAPLGAGVYLDSSAAFTSDSSNLAIEGAADYPVALTMMALGSIPAGSYKGNGNDQFLIIGPNANVFADMTIHDRGVPISIQVASMTIGGPINDTTPVTLTVEAGVTLRFVPLAGGPGARVIFGGNGNPPYNKVGTLLALGTAAKPIIFTSGAASPQAGDWSGLWLDTSPGSRLDHVVIEYAGGFNGIVSSNCRPTSSSDAAALVVGDFSDQYVPPANLISNSIIANSASHGINAVWQAADFSPILTGNGNQFVAINGCEQTLNDLTTGPCPTASGCQ